MAIEKTTNDFFSGLRHQSDQNFKYDRLRRMISGAKEEINRNPKNFIPQLPEAIREKFTQNDSTLSNGSVLNQSNKSTNKSQHEQKSLNRSKKQNGSLKKIDEHDENHRSPLKVSNSKYKLKSFTGDSDDETLVDKSNTNQTVSMRCPLGENQAERSRRDPTLLEKSEILSDRNLVPQQQDNSKLSMHSTRYLRSANRHMNSTAISSEPRANKTFIPITPIHASKVSKSQPVVEHKLDISSDEEFDESASTVSDQSTKRTNATHTKNATTTTAPSVSNNNNNNNTKSNSKLELPSRKSLNFQNSGQPSRLSIRDESNAKKTNVSSSNVTQNKNITKTINESPNKSQQNKTQNKTTKNISATVDHQSYTRKSQNTSPINENDSDDSVNEPPASSSNHILTRSRNKTRTINNTPNRSQLTSRAQNNTKSINNKSNNVQNEYDNFDDQEVDNRTKSINKSSKMNATNKSNKTKDASKLKSIHETANDTEEESDEEKSAIKDSNNSRPKIVSVQSLRASDTATSRFTDLSVEKNDKSKSNQKEKSKNEEKEEESEEDEISIIDDIPAKSHVSKSIQKEKTRNEEEDDEISIVDNVPAKPNASKINQKEKVESEKEEEEEEEDEISIVNNVPPVASPAKIAKSKITIEKLNKKPSDQTKTSKVDNSLTNVIDEFQGILAKKAANKQLDRLKTPSQENASMNQSETELIKTNNEIFIRKSFAKSGNSTGSTTINNTTSKSTSYVKKSIAELTTPFLTNPKQAKISFVAPSAPPPPRPRSPINMAPPSKPSKNTTASEMLQMGFSNIEPVDMFSPSSTILAEDQNEPPKTTQSKPLVIIKKKQKQTNKENTKSQSKSQETKNKNSKPLKTISNTVSSSTSSSSLSSSPPESPKRKASRRPIKPTQEREKNFRVRRQTILPVETHDDDLVEPGLRRSKRVKIDSSTVPIYEWETITDFKGKKIVVQTIVGATKRTCTLNDYFNEIEEKHNKVPVKPAIPAKSRVIQPKRDYSDSEHSDNEESPREETTNAKQKPNKKPRNSLETSANETSSDSTSDNNHFNENTFKSSQPIVIKKNLNVTDLTEASLMLDAEDAQVNVSQESILFQDVDSSLKVKKHVINFHHNMKSIDFQECYEGVGLKAFTENNGYICIEPNGWTRTQTHPTECEYTLTSGNCLISLNGQVTRLADVDIVNIPAEVSYKIKNISSSKKAYLYFRFFQS